MGGRLNKHLVAVTKSRILGLVTIGLQKGVRGGKPVEGCWKSVRSSSRIAIVRRIMTQDIAQNTFWLVILRVRYHLRISMPLCISGHERQKIIVDHTGTRMCRFSLHSYL